MTETTPRISPEHHLGGAALGTISVVLCGMLLSFSLHSIYLELSGTPHGRIFWLVAVLLALGLIGSAAALRA